MRNRSLILSPTFDVHAAAAVWGLRQMGFESIWSKSGSLADSAVGAFSLYSDDDSDWLANGGLDSIQARSVWYRRARDPRHFPGSAACDNTFLREEWSLCQRNVFALADDLSEALWINRPQSARMTENKLVQLRAARRCGLRFPATLVSNDPAEIHRFRALHPRVIYKPFVMHSWVEEASSRGYIAHARILEPDACIDDASLELCPGIYQAYVDKVCDLRITAIGDRLFPIRLGTNAGGAFVDWRSHVDCDEFRATPCDIPDAYAGKLKALMAELGIVFGCIDVVLDKQGELHFLEVNQGGQFLFAERWVQSLPLLKAMCEMLACGRPDYALDPACDISYQAFRESDAYSQWSEEAKESEAAEDTRSFVTYE